MSSRAPPNCPILFSAPFGAFKPRLEDRLFRLLAGDVLRHIDVGVKGRVELATIGLADQPNQALLKFKKMGFRIM